jgi:oligopeptide/dipeptide ABC transporter ATP-binding protein
MSDETSPALVVQDLEVLYKPRGGGQPIRAVDGVSFTLNRGETLGLIGESGSGKTSLARALMQLVPVSRGHARVGGTDFATLRGAALRAARPKLQMVFQDPTASLDPRMKIGDSIAEPLVVQRRGSKQDQRDRLATTLSLVGLHPDHAERYPHELSGGQKQRAGIARALILDPEVIICDEAVSALDVALQAEILELLKRLQRELGLSYLFITHDLGVVANVADRVAVMYLGRLAELADVGALIDRPRHPYSEALISAQPRFVPEPGWERIVLNGDLPSPADPPSGCRFRTRCRYVVERCAVEEPPLRELSSGQSAACHRGGELHLQGLKGNGTATTHGTDEPSHHHVASTFGIAPQKG